MTTTFFMISTAITAKLNRKKWKEANEWGWDSEGLIPYVFFGQLSMTMTNFIKQVKRSQRRDVL